MVGGGSALITAGWGWWKPSSCPALWHCPVAVGWIGCLMADWKSRLSACSSRSFCDVVVVIFQVFCLIGCLCWSLAGESSLLLQCFLGLNYLFSSCQFFSFNLTMKYCSNLHFLNIALFRDIIKWYWVRTFTLSYLSIYLIKKIFKKFWDRLWLNCSSCSSKLPTPASQSDRHTSMCHNWFMHRF